ncbi:hypothetical protein Q1695_003404 [Nippostrongylus brasiliensis]|nr:hypothetical protein Q1695_003404 [Nippostrongylus brasiliensis]
MLRLTRELKHQSISRQRDDSSEEDELHRERRRSARLNPKHEQECIRDSGTESDEDELEEIAQQQSVTAKNMDAFLSGSPPALSSSPPVASDIDTESWDSFGRESGILTGEGDLTSDDDECPTPKPRRRMHGGAFNSVKFSKEQCEFPLINVCGTAEKRRYSMTESTDNEPIACRLRSNNAARRAPVRLLINKPYARNGGGGASAPREPAPPASSSEPPCPAPKRNRCNSWRPCLDLDKMIKNRISNETLRGAANQKDPSTQEHSTKI